MSDAGAGSSARSRTRSKGGICFEVERGGEPRRVRLAQDVDVSDPDSITTSEPDGREYADAIPELTLPGSGGALFDCGDDVPALFCPECGEPATVSRTCRRSRCPRCWQAWAFRQAKTAVGKLEGLRRYRSANGDRKSKLHHLTVPFPESTRFDSDDALGRAFEAVKRLLEEVNAPTGYLLYHPFRIREEYRGEVNGHPAGDGDMNWADVLEKVESEAWSWEAVREEFLVYAPHFHVIALSRFVQGGAVTERIEEQTGVVIHRITKGEDSAVSIYDLNDLCSAMTYSLSHVGLTEGANGSFRAAYRPFGEVANFTPTPGVWEDVDRVIRDIAPTVLGMHFPEERTCDAEHVDEEKVAAGAGAAVRALAAEAGNSSVPAEAGDDGWGPAGSLSLSGDAGGTGGSGAGGGAWEAMSGVVPDFTVEPPESITTRCGARLRPMGAAGEYLTDLDWRANVDDATLARLEDAYREWCDRERPEPPAPPPEPPPA